MMRRGFAMMWSACCFGTPSGVCEVCEVCEVGEGGRGDCIWVFMGRWMRLEVGQEEARRGEARRKGTGCCRL